MTEIIQANENDAKLIATIAKPIWEEHYTPIIGKAQVAYMLDKFQSAESIAHQIKQDTKYFLVLDKALSPNSSLTENDVAGYLAIELKPERLFISKFYLNKQFRGRGFARRMLEFVESQALYHHCHLIELTVNKFNPAYHAYLALGFEDIGPVVADIGGGYVMDDFHMQKRLSRSI